MICLLTYKEVRDIENGSIKWIDERYRELNLVLEKVNEGKSYRFFMGPLGAFFSVELRYEEYVAMDPAIRENLVKLRKDKETLIISDKVPLIVERSVLAREKKTEIEIVKNITKDENYGNEPPVPYEIPIIETERRTKEFKEVLERRSLTGHQKIKRDLEFVPVIPSLGNSRITGHAKIGLGEEHQSHPEIPESSEMEENEPDDEEKSSWGKSVSSMEISLNRENRSRRNLKL